MEEGGAINIMRNKLPGDVAGRSHLGNPGLTIKSLHVSRNTYINEAVSFYNEFNRRKYLQKKLHKESLRLRNNSVKILREMEKIYSE